MRPPVSKDSRRRMVVSAATLIGSRGVEATSFADILSDSRAPRGSIYHHFPEGKEGLVEAAMQWTNEQVLAYQRSCTARNASGVLDHFVGLFRASMVASQCRAGCPIAGVIVDTYSGDDRRLRLGRSSFRGWQELLTRQLVATGMPGAKARSLAVTTLAAVEGALILCRAERSPKPLEVVARQLRTLASEPKRRASRRGPPGSGRPRRTTRRRTRE
jgi:TetR/AcrR family transcriptional regulator, lmrAB and yxaGH operons repressor